MLLLLALYCYGIMSPVTGILSSLQKQVFQVLSFFQSNRLRQTPCSGIYRWLSIKHIPGIYLGVSSYMNNTHQSELFDSLTCICFCRFQLRLLPGAFHESKFGKDTCCSASTVSSACSTGWLWVIVPPVSRPVHSFQLNGVSSVFSFQPVVRDVFQ